MTPAQNRLRRLLLPTVSPIYDGTKRIGRIMTRLNKDFQPQLIEYSEIESEPITLQKGDYTLPITEEKWNELLDIEGSKYTLSHSEAIGMLYDGRVIVHALEIMEPRTLLTFEQFKQRTINTFNEIEKP